MGAAENIRPVPRVAVVTDIRLYRDGLAILLRHAGVEVTATAESARSALECVARTKPDVALVDLATPSWRSIVAGLRTVAAETRTVALGVIEREETVLECAQAGVAAYVSREASVDDLVRALMSVGKGELVCSPQIAGILYRRAGMYEPRPESFESIDRLTRRELEIVDLIEQGLSNKEIAQRLTIEQSTVKNHVHNILEKLGVHRRVDAAARVLGHTGALRV